MKYILKITSLILLLVTIYSCSKESGLDNSKLDLSEIEVLSEFGKQFPKEYSNLEIKNMQNREGNIITN